jgi:hypothetical protein
VCTVDERLRAAVHEAGHAVVATLLGVPFDLIELTEDGWGLMPGDPTRDIAYNLLGLELTPARRRLCRSSLLVAVGGGVAEVVAIRGVADAEAHWNHWRRAKSTSGDRRQAGAAAELLCPEGPVRAERQAVAAVVAAFRCPLLAGAVVAVAGSLVAGYGVGGDSIRSVAPMLHWPCDACPSPRQHRRPLGAAWSRRAFWAAIGEAEAASEALQAEAWRVASAAG